jgi:acetate kinase
LRVLAVNAGSSTVKLSLLGDEDQTLAEHDLAAPRSQVDQRELLTALGDGLDDADVAVHRIVHGGERFTEATRIDPGVVAQLRELTALAPLHQPKSLSALAAVSSLLPHVPAVACFDTAFHATLAPAAFTYAVPARWRSRWGVRRYGFHGLSPGWVAGRPALRLDEPHRIVSCHLGAGASLCAIHDGRSVDTTMGFTPLAGLVMATRSGDVDPGMLLWLLERETLTERELAAALEHESGLLGLTQTADMREALVRAQAGDPAARLGVDVYLHRLRAGIAAMGAAMGGLDALVFTGGVGEHAPAIRSGAADGLGFLGIAVDGRANLAVQGDGEIGTARAAVRTLVIHAREDLEMARQARLLLDGQSVPAPPPQSTA